jgi:hypothetical protein
MALSSKQHQAALNLAAQRLADTVSALVPDPTEAHAMWESISGFLTGRAHPDWMANHLGVIA